MITITQGENDAYISADTADQLYVAVLQQLMECGSVSSPRGQQTKELLGVTLKLRDPNYNLITLPARKLNYPFSVAEWLWIMLGLNSTDLIVPYNRNLMQFSDTGRTFTGAYGPKFIDQLDYVLDLLEEDQDSRQGVINLWRERPRASKDVPCTITFQFLIRQEKLHMTVYMRSNDAWLGLPYDLFSFTQIQRYLAMELAVGVGTYTHMVGSLHIYDRDFDKIQALLDHGRQGMPEGFTRLPDMTPMPPAFKAMYMGLTMMARDSVGPEEIKRWVLPNADALMYPWNFYLLLLAWRFHHDVEHLPFPFCDLVEYQQKFEKQLQRADLKV